MPRNLRREGWLTKTCQFSEFSCQRENSAHPLPTAMMGARHNSLGGLNPKSHDACKKCHVTKPKVSCFVPSAPSATRRQSYCTKIWRDVSVPAAQWTKKSGQLICTHSWHKFNFSLETQTISDSPKSPSHNQTTVKVEIVFSKDASLTSNGSAYLFLNFCEWKNNRGRPALILFSIRNQCRPYVLRLSGLKTATWHQSTAPN